MNTLDDINLLSQEELNNVVSGAAHLPMNPKYKKKANCTAEAKKLLASGTITGMTEREIAQEIFFHAYVYYAGSEMIKNPLFKVFKSIIVELMEHADPIDIVDGGDTAFRKSAYKLGWNLPDLD